MRAPKKRKRVLPWRFPLEYRLCGHQPSRVARMLSSSKASPDPQALNIWRGYSTGGGVHWRIEQLFHWCRLDVQW